MKPFWSYVIFCILSTSTLSVAAGVDTVWVARLPVNDPWGYPCQTRGMSMALDRDNCYILGQAYSHSPGNEFSYGFFVKYSLDSTFLWGTWLIGYAEYWEPYAMCYCPEDNTIAAAGAEWELPFQPNKGLRSFKCDLNGNIIWRARYVEQFGFGQEVATDDSGNVYVVGATSYPGYKYYGIILRYNALPNSNDIGIIDWLDKYKGTTTATSYVNAFLDVACDTVGNVYVTGYSRDSAGGYNIVTIKYDCQTGTRAWIKKYEGIYEDLGDVITTDDANYVYVAGRSMASPGSEGIVVLKYTPSGDTVWTARHDEAGSYLMANDIAVDTAGNIYVTGEDRDDIGFIMKYSSNGLFEWIRYDGGRGIALDKSNNIYVTGSGAGYVTSKYKPNGDTLWTTYAPTLEEVNDIALDNEGYVYVTGGSGNGYLTTTVKYFQLPVGIVEKCEVENAKTVNLNVYPNPFTQNLNIRYSVHDTRFKPQTADRIEKAVASINIYDAIGRLIRNLPSSTSCTPLATVKWNGTDNLGHSVPPGIYFVELTIDLPGEGDDSHQTEKVVLLK